MLTNYVISLVKLSIDLIACRLASLTGTAISFYYNNRAFSAPIILFDEYVLSCR